MTRTLHGTERSEAGASAPIGRPRLFERLRSLTTYPVALLIAPAGYGKSVVLRQYLDRLRDPYRRFALRPEHGSLLGFLRGFAEALNESAPHAITSLAGAYERTTTSPKRGTDLARWMQAHLEDFEGVIAIDDLHLADADPEIARFLSALIERTKGRIRWIVASRSRAGLPVGTWLAYGDADLPLDERELRFTLDEARETAVTLGLAFGDDELSDLLALTEGWPAAMSFALRTSTRSSDLRNVSALTREMIYRFLAEQVYSELDEDERALLEVAIALPALDVPLLERAGFDRALPMVERLASRTAFIYEESPGVYQCHDLFREFLRHQSALGGKHAMQDVHERAARALESGGDAEHAIASYAKAGATDDVVRLLELHGFDLLERARGDVVAGAIEVLPETTRRDNATILALRGVLQAIAGRFVRAESLLRRSLSRAGSDRNLIAITSLRLASLVGNRGSDVSDLLAPVAEDRAQGATYRAEALSLIAARHAIAGESELAESMLRQAEALLPAVDADATLAKIFHHLGIVSRRVGDVNKAFERLIASSQLATEHHLYGLASRAYAVLSNLSLHEMDDVAAQLAYAELAAESASKDGDAFSAQTALLQLLSAHMRRGDIEKSIAAERQLTSMPTDETAVLYVRLFRSVRLAWEGRFGEAHRLMASCWRQMHHDFDRVACGSQYALFLALEGLRESAIETVNEVVDSANRLEVRGLFPQRSLTMSKALCSFAEMANGRHTQAERILRRLKGTDEISRLITEIATNELWDLRHAIEDVSDRVRRGIEELSSIGYRDMSRTLTAVCVTLRDRAATARSIGELTVSEQAVLRMLAEGMLPKEIADQTTRSVNTVRVHIANAIGKLNCRGRSQAIEVARRRGII